VPSFVVDPVLSTTLPDEAGADETRQWLLALQGWLLAVESSPFEWKHFLQCSAALQEIGRFPTFDVLRSAQKKANADINIGSVLGQLRRFFQDDTHDLLATTVTKCVIVKEPAPSVVPSEILGRNLAETREPLGEGLFCLACDKAAGVRFARVAHIVTAPLQHPENEITVSGTIDEIDPDDMVTRVGAAQISQQFSRLQSPDGLAAFHYDALVEGGQEHFCTLVASIAARLYPGAAILSMSAGAQLWRSLGQSGILENRFAAEKMLKICAAAVTGRLDEVNASRHKIRQSRAGDSPQETRESDKAKAWRLNITKEGAGYRLHYWHALPREGHVEHIEFANVLCETDPVVIPEG
jgi:hypothetical protein